VASPSGKFYSDRINGIEPLYPGADCRPRPFGTAALPLIRMALIGTGIFFGLRLLSFSSLAHRFSGVVW